MRYSRANPISALWFHLATNSLLSTLNQYRQGYQIKSHTAETCTICHLLFTRNRRQRNQLIEIVELFTLTSLFYLLMTPACYLLTIRLIVWLKNMHNTSKIINKWCKANLLSLNYEKHNVFNLEQKMLCKMIARLCAAII
jgi:hypothetical protein